ncbi:hypothetical protein MPER_11323, partial [Moniliophthora perniciosa FA553]
MAIDQKTPADGRDDSRIQNYSKFWHKDTSKETDVDNANRSKQLYKRRYYDGATELYEWGWAQSFHFSRFYKGESFAASLARHEHYLAFKMGLKP